MRWKGKSSTSERQPSKLLVAADGTTYPLVKDDGSKLLFLEKQLHGRTVRLTGRIVPDSKMLKVTQIHTLVDGKPHEVKDMASGDQTAADPATWTPSS